MRHGFNRASAQAAAETPYKFCRFAAAKRKNRAIGFADEVAAALLVRELGDSDTADLHEVANAASAGAALHKPWLVFERDKGRNFE